MVIRDPREEVLPAVGWVEIEDLETGERRLINTGSRKRRERYAQEARAQWQEVEQTLSKLRCPLVEIRTDRSYLPVLMRYFKARRRRRGAE